MERTSTSNTPSLKKLNLRHGQSLGSILDHVVVLWEGGYDVWTTRNAAGELSQWAYRRAMEVADGEPSCQLEIPF